MHLFTGSVITIDFNVLHNDGGVLAACVNAASLAIIDAGIPISDYITATSVGLISHQPILDLNRFEESSNFPECTIGIVPHSSKIVLLHMESRMNETDLNKIWSTSIDGAQRMKVLLDEGVRKRTARLIAMRDVSSAE